MKNAQKFSRNSGVISRNPGIQYGTNMKVAVLSNISSSENTKEVENNLLDMAKSVSKALIENGYDVVLVNADDKMISVMKREKPGIIFNLAERFNGNPDLTPHVAALLEMNNIPFTGASHIIFAICDDKVRAKELMQYYNIPTPNFQVFESGNEKLNQELKFPLIVKPSNTHDSIGINENSVVHNEKDMKNEVSYTINELKQRAIVEEFIDGREFNVAVLGNESPYTLPICEADLTKSKNRILSYEMKWHIDWYKEAPIICPVNLPKHLQNALKDLAIKVHSKLGLMDYSRVDIRLDKRNIPHVLEVNANPGLTEDCFIFNAAKVAGISYSQLINRILQHAAERYKIPVKVKVRAK